MRGTQEDDMMNRIEHVSEPVSGNAEVRRYAAKHDRQPRLTYTALLDGIRGVNPTGRCLEVGAGTGALSCLLAREYPGVTITACDISPHMVDLARGNVHKNGLDGTIRCVCADVNNQKEMARLGTFDLVYSAYSLHHWRDPGRALINLWRTLADGGTLHILDLKRVWWLYVLPGNGGFLSSIRASYRPAEIEDIFKALGITSCRIETAFPGIIQSIVARK